MHPGSGKATLRPTGITDSIGISVLQNVKYKTCTEKPKHAL